MNRNIKIENVYCIGRNFIEHAKELNNEIPPKPLIFQKPNSSINTDNTIEIPRGENIDHEVEIVLLVGKTGIPKNPQEAKGFISGFSLGLDLTKRKLQTELKAKGLPWFPAKSFKGSAVLDDNFKNECPNEFHLIVNQEKRQTGRVKDMIFSFEDIILHLSKVVSLKRGDIIFTGTPEGAGPLKRGDQIEMGFINQTPKECVVI